MRAAGKKRLRSFLLVLLGLLVLFLLSQFVLRPRVLRNSRALALYGRERYAEASGLWRKNAGRKDGDPLPESGIGKVEYRQGKHAEAKNWYSQAVQDKGNKPGLLYDQGNALFRTNDLDKALKSYKTAMLLDPKDTDAKLNYELVLRRQGYQPPPPPPKGKDGEQDEERQDQPAPEDKKEQYENTLDALDQKEALDRQTRKKPEKQEVPDRWW